MKHNGNRVEKDCALLREIRFTSTSLLSLSLREAGLLARLGGYFHCISIVLRILQTFISFCYQVKFFFTS